MKKQQIIKNDGAIKKKKIKYLRLRNTSKYI